MHLRVQTESRQLRMHAWCSFSSTPSRRSSPRFPQALVFACVITPAFFKVLPKVLLLAPKRAGPALFFACDSRADFLALCPTTRPHVDVHSRLSFPSCSLPSTSLSCACARARARARAFSPLPSLSLSVSCTRSPSLRCVHAQGGDEPSVLISRAGLQPLSSLYPPSSSSSSCTVARRDRGESPSGT